MNLWEVATAMLRRPMSVAPGAETGAIACERALMALLGVGSDERPASIGARGCVLDRVGASLVPLASALMPCLAPRRCAEACSPKGGGRVVDVG